MFSTRREWTEKSVPFDFPAARDASRISKGVTACRVPYRSAYESSRRHWDACSARRDAASARRSTGDRRCEREVREGVRSTPGESAGATLEDRSFAICRRRGTKRRAVQSAPLAILGARRSFFSSRATRDAGETTEFIPPMRRWLAVARN